MSNLKRSIAPFEQADTRKSIWQITNTILPFVTFWFFAYRSLSVSFWVTLLFAIPASGFLVRTFIIFHDCCHISFFKSKKANALVGNITGILTTFPYEQWKFEHAVHHATNGNLDRRGTGDIWTLTVNEYSSLSSFKKMIYRLYRNPIVLFGLGPLYIVLIQYRFNRKLAGRKERWNTYATNTALIAVWGGISWLLGWRAVLLVEAPIVYLSAMVGIWLFYVQHQFDNGYFENAENWSYESSAMEGSSFYKLPKPLQWITGNIGFHHIHHLSSRVPNYNLQKVSESDDFFQSIPSIGFWSSLRSLRHRLWDEQEKRFVNFKDAKNI
ncbi:fatty acid desaturase [Alicyclobacillus curvatus]|nr:fatty acid desaturase [Alicyclobacillus curvatus]